SASKHPVRPLVPLSCWYSLAQVIKSNLTLTLKAFSKMPSPFDVNAVTIYIKSPCHIRQYLHQLPNTSSLKRFFALSTHLPPKLFYF
ncbi:hypothetical protein, partial [Clostridium sp. MCC353]|uniref:hypothetical protein n=1 Tax=Clostridium sp. MCC353 TaxID=2592646 RepID=UPI001C01ABD1